MGFHVSGYSVHPTCRRHLQALLEDPSRTGKPGFHHGRFFAPAGWPATVEQLRSAVGSGQPAVLGREQCCVLFDVHGPSGLHGIEVAIEVGGELAPFLARWMPRVFGDPDAAERMTRGGIFGLRGREPFEFGHLRRADLVGRNWDELHLDFSDEEYDEIHQSSLSDLLTDAMALVFSRSLEAIDQRFPGQADAVLLLVPSYIEHQLDPDDAAAAIPWSRDLGG